jgi:non-specific serine/threonine protein kinase
VESFGPLLREFRLAAGLSQELLAERAHISPAAVSTLERGTRKAPQRQTVALLGEALRLAPHDRERLEMSAAASRRRKLRDGTKRRAVANNLPHLLSSFEGRERELALLAEALVSRRLITLLGPGGVGKTRLSLEAASAFLKTADVEGIWFVDLSPFTDPHLVTGAVAAAIGVRELSTKPLVDSLTEWLAPKRVLLILDNCEHVIDETARVAERLLHGCANVRIIATSREPLRIDGELRMMVDPLALEDVRADGPAVRMFLDRVAESRPFRSAPLDDADLNAARVICQRLDGLPLALELAAARAREFPLSEIAARLSGRFQLLNNGRRTASPRQQTLRGAIDWSYVALDPGEQRLFAWLSAFAGSFTSEDAVAVCDAGDGSARDGLVSLIAKSLISVVEDSAGRIRYRYLETIRAYAHERLEERGEYDAAITRFTQYMTDFAVQIVDRYPGEIPRPIVNSLEPQVDNIREALYLLLAAKRNVQLGAHLAVASGRLFWQLALFAESIRWCELALSEPLESAALEASLLATSCSALFNLGDMPRVLERAARAATLFDEASEPGPLSAVLLHAMHANYQMGRMQEAQAFADRALHCARRSGEDWRIGVALRMSGLLAEGEDARRLMEEALRHLRSGEQSGAVATVLMGIAEACFAQGDVEKALRYGHEAVETARRHSHRARVAGGLTNVAAYSLAARDIDGARECVREALLTVRDMGASMNAMYSLQHAGSCAAFDGNGERAARMLGASDRLYEEFAIVRELTEQKLYDMTLDMLRSAMPEAEFARHYAEGKSLPVMRAIDEALDGVLETSP